MAKPVKALARLEGGWRRAWQGEGLHPVAGVRGKRSLDLDLEIGFVQLATAYFADVARHDVAASAHRPAQGDRRAPSREGGSRFRQGAGETGAQPVRVIRRQARQAWQAWTAGRHRDGDPGGATRAACDPGDATSAPTSRESAGPRSGRDPS